MKIILFTSFAVIFFLLFLLFAPNVSYSAGGQSQYTFIPSCVKFILQRPGWISSTVMSKTRATMPSGISLILSSNLFAGTETIAITLPDLDGGSTIYIKDDRYFDPYSVEGVGYWAHELKHSQQLSDKGLLGFMNSYLSDYLGKGGYANISLERDAQLFQQQVVDQLNKEVEYNNGAGWCLQNTEYESNPEWKMLPSD